ncbi:MAG: hypothetical protein RR424_09520 [Oscillospiraceae bacterium]
MNEKKLDFLLGALSPTGYCGYYSQINNNPTGSTAALIKAAPGCGKSTLLKKLASELLRRGETVELIHCSQDPDSLDGVICARLHFAIVDSTPPHSMEPLYPIAYEDIVSLYDAVDREALQSKRSEIVELFDKYKALQERATRYITAAGSLLQDSMRVAGAFTDISKARSLANALAHRYIVGSGNATEEIRLLSAISLQGQLFYTETITKLAKTIVVFDDEYGVASKAMLYYLRDYALQKGCDIITCYCSMSPYDKIEHLFIPSLSLGFITSNTYHTLSLAQQRTIHCTRFCDLQGIKQRRARLRFNKKTIAELFSQASIIQNEAKLTHDELESYYTNALKYDVLDKAYDTICARL